MVESAHYADMMHDRLRSAIDLPQKLFVWEEDGRAFVACSDQGHLAWRHGIDGENERLATIAGALETLATTATGP